MFEAKQSFKAVALPRRSPIPRPRAVATENRAPMRRTTAQKSAAATTSNGSFQSLLDLPRSALIEFGKVSMVGTEFACRLGPPGVRRFVLMILFAEYIMVGSFMLSLTLWWECASCGYGNECNKDVRCGGCLCASRSNSIGALSEPVVLRCSASNPIAVLSAPVVRLKSASSFSGVFWFG